MLLADVFNILMGQNNILFEECAIISKLLISTQMKYQRSKRTNYLEVDDQPQDYKFRKNLHIRL